jgi:hypothetical protein
MWIIVIDYVNNSMVSGASAAKEIQVQAGVERGNPLHDAVNRKNR